MNTILMAAARGARIEYRVRGGMHRNVWGIWRTSHFVAWSKPYQDEYQFRIHPDDEHLRFGPISSALREAAVKPPVYAGFLGYPVWGHVCNDMRDSSPHRKRNGRMYYEHAEELHRSLFLLVLSEALAQEGL